MKKYLLFLLMLTASLNIEAQTTLANKLRITGNVTDNTATKLNVQATDGTVNTISKTELQDAFYFATASALPVVGITDKLYVTRDDNKLYRFNGTIYVPFSGGITSTATNNFIPKVNAGGNLENSIVSQINGGVLIKTPLSGTTAVLTVQNDTPFTGTQFLQRWLNSAGVDQGLLDASGNFTLRNSFRGNSITATSRGSASAPALGVKEMANGPGLFAPSALDLAFSTNNIERGRLHLSGRWSFNSQTDDGTNLAQFNGTISVATATQPNQAPRFEQEVNTSTNQTNIVGRKSLVSTDAVAGGISVNNSKTTGGADAFGVTVINSGSRGISVDSSAGTAIFASNGVNQVYSSSKFGSAVGLLINDIDGTGTGDAISYQRLGGGTPFRVTTTGTVFGVAGTDNNNLVTVGQVKSRDGWASYSTTTYTNASPFVVAPNTTVTLPNNANNSITTDLPLGVTAFYNGTTNKITPASIGDAYTVNVRFKATSTGALGNDYLELGLDIGSGSPVIKETQFFRGMGVEQYFNFVLPIFSLTTFVTNGGTLQITSHNGTLNIYDISYYINRNYTRQ